MKNLFLILILLAFMAGCVTSEREVSQTVGNQPINYKEGYAAGADSGLAAAGNPYYRFKKDVTRYLEDDLYKMGWNDGYAAKNSMYNNLTN